MARRRGTPRIITPRLASRATPPSRLARTTRDARHAPRPFASSRVRSERVQTRSQGVERRGRDRRIHARPRRARRLDGARRVGRPARRERERASVRRVAPGSLARRGGAREGRHFHRFGCARGDATWLFPEECAFLVETERLALFLSDSDEEPASVRAVYALLTRCGVSREEYLVYGYLCRLGFGCRRFGAAWTADARADAETWSADADGLGRWARRAVRDGDGVMTKKRRVEVPVMSREGGAASRAWWPWTRHPGHAWIGPEIHDAVEANAPRAPAPLEYDETPVRVSPTFQVYQPNRSFSKKSPDPVSFFVYVRSEKPPDGREMRSLLDQAGGKPVRVVNCRQSTVMMFTFSDANT